MRKDRGAEAYRWQGAPPGWWQAHDGRWYPPAVLKTATLGRRGGEGTLAFTYDQQLIDRLKALDIGVVRDPERNCWLYPFDAMRLVMALLDGLGYVTCFDLALHLELVGERRERWAADLLEASPPHLRRSVYTALARVLHPDVGGDAALMRCLNRAWEEVGAGSADAAGRDAGPRDAGPQDAGGSRKAT